MSIKKLSTDELLGINKFFVDEDNPHIVIDKDKCSDCKEKACLYVCPAGLYTIKNDNITFDYAGCLECGTCRTVCTAEGITKWAYPKGTFGVEFRYG
ncbi:ferredoxin family protein [Pectinatus brassicae]|uniref:ferredoxin family protein n=1 Tax=Pectinatus brassicae TaxID=862415 RepID=UPI0018C84F61|nr:ferredoxin family protein [Pectinatus brassicae]